jgi:hypothetical protein
MIVGLSILVGFLIGLVGGSLFGVPVFNYLASDNDWRKLANPTEKAVKFLSYDYWNEKVYVKASSGNIYACDTSTCTGLTEIPQDESPIDLIYGWGIFSTPEPPGLVVARLQVSPNDPETAEQIDHIILNDGSIWRWSKTSISRGDIPANFLTIEIGIIGTFLGFVGGILFILFKRVRNRIRA